MNREFAKKFLEDAKFNPEFGGDVAAYEGAVGTEQALTLIESFRNIMYKPRAFQETERELNKINVYEAGMGASATAVFSVLGVSSLIQEAYQLPGATPLDDTIITTPSSTFAEPKAWMGKPDYPKPLADGEEPDLTRMLMRSRVIPNMDFGLAFEISRRALDDDQVGQLAMYPGWIGKQHKQHEEIWAAGTLTGAAFSNSGVSVPGQQYDDPDGTSGIYTTTGDRANAITSAAFDTTPLIDLLNLSKEIKDWGGKTLLVAPDLIIGGIGISFNAARVLNSAFWASTSNTTGASGALSNVNSMAVNPLDPKWGALRAPIDYREEPFFTGSTDRKKWYLIQSGKAGGIGLIKQDRQSLEVTMEAPNAGRSVRARSYYHRTYRRAAWYIAEARYVFRGSDGSV